MTRKDRIAMSRAIKLCRAEGPASATQIDEMLKDRGFEEAGQFAAYSCQNDFLQVRPWQPVPCSDEIRRYFTAFIDDGDDGIMGRYAAACIARRLRDFDLSLYEPDPLRAIEKAEAAKREADADADAARADL
jgi:hypothetical protein